MLSSHIHAHIYNVDYKARTFSVPFLNLSFSLSCMSLSNFHMNCNQWEIACSIFHMESMCPGIRSVLVVTQICTHIQGHYAVTSPPFCKYAFVFYINQIDNHIKSLCSLPVLTNWRDFIWPPDVSIAKTPSAPLERTLILALCLRSVVSCCSHFACSF